MLEKNKIYGALFLLSIVIILFSSCNKEDERVEQEKIKLTQYLEEMGYDQIEPTSSGLYYVELQPSDGISPVRSDHVIINFTGRLIDGTIFDTSDRALAATHNIERSDKLYGPYKFLLDNMSIAGLREGLTLMNEGGVSRIIIPSNLAFGQSSVGVIEPFSTLIYDVELLEVINDPAEHEQRLLDAWLEENEIGTEAEPSGLYFIETEAGSGNLPGPDQTVALHYQGALIDGRIFDRSEAGKSWTLNMNNSANYIPGFIEGIKKMSVGSKATFIIPSNIGYGPLGSAEGIIPPYSTLIFEVEVVNIY